MIALLSILIVIVIPCSWVSFCSAFLDGGAFERNHPRLLMVIEVGACAAYALLIISLLLL